MLSSFTLRFPGVLVLCAVFSAGALAQGFNPSMPANVPPVSGPVVEAASLRYIDIQPGTGAPALPGQRYTVHYTGWLRDGTKFDSSADRGEPFSFLQGRRLVIPGWDLGFEGMKVGGKRRLFIPYQLAYGEGGSGPIPPKSELIFDIELLGVEAAVEKPAAQDLLAPLADTEKKLLALARAIPESKYDWRPAADIRSIRELLLHVRNGNLLLLSIATKQPGAAVSNRTSSSSEPQALIVES
jgi:hypothetical protein